MNKKFFEKYGPVFINPWSDGVHLGVLLEVPLSNIRTPLRRNGEAPLAIGRVFLYSGGNLIDNGFVGIRCYSSKEEFTFSGSVEIVEYSYLFDVPPGRCINGDTFINVLVDDIESGLIPVAVPVKFP